MTKSLGKLLRWGTTAATIVMAAGAILWWTPWHTTAEVVIVCSAAMFAALPAAGLLAQAVAYRRARDVLYVVLTSAVVAIVVANAVVGGVVAQP